MSSPAPGAPVPPEPEPAVAPWQVAVLLGGAVGMALLLAVLPVWLPQLGASLFGPDPKGYWYLTRASGMVAYALAWLSMIFGVLISKKLARMWPGGPTALALHEHTSLLALAFTVFHAAILLLIQDQYIHYSLPEIVIPFAGATYRPLQVGLGQIALYAFVVVTVTFYLRRQIGQRAWRVIHGFSYGVFVLALLHGILSGTDSTNLWVWLYYAVTGISLLFLTIYRLLVWHERATTVREGALSGP
jgi:predicted ferric reductase